MTERLRLAMLLLALAVLLPAVWRIAVALPPFGAPTSRYGQTVNDLLPRLRNVSNMVVAVNSDVRGIDTVGEELMMLAAATGATVLLRGRRGEALTERAGRAPGRPTVARADAAVLLSRIGAIALGVFGLYVMLTGLSADDGLGRAGLLLAMVGHGLVKGSLFMVAGILLALEASVDEIDLYGRARRLWPVGLVMGAAGLLLGGVPLGLLHGGAQLIDAATAGRPALHAAHLAAAALTGAAVLRAALRIFAGVSGAPGPERDGASEREHEKNDRPLWLMLAPCAGLVGLTVLPAPWGEHLARIGAAGLPGPSPGPTRRRLWSGCSLRSVSRSRCSLCPCYGNGRCPGRPAA